MSTNVETSRDTNIVLHRNSESQKVQTSIFFTLPVDIIKEILKRLEGSDIGRFSKTSQQFKALADKYCITYIKNRLPFLHSFLPQKKDAIDFNQLSPTALYQMATVERSAWKLARAFKADSLVTEAVFLNETTLVTDSLSDELHLWNLKDGWMTAKTLKEHASLMEILPLNKDHFATSSPADPIYIWNRDGTLHSTIEVPNVSPCLPVAMAHFPENRLIMGKSDKLYILNVKGNSDLKQLEGSSADSISSILVLKDEKIVTRSVFGDVELWNLNSTTGPTTICKDSKICCMTKLADGCIALGCEPAQVQIWNPGEKDSPPSLVRTIDFENSTQGIFSIAQLLDGRLVTGHDDGTLIITDLKGIEEPVLLNKEGVKNNRIRSIKILDEGHFAVTTGTRDFYIFSTFAKDAVKKTPVKLSQLDSPTTTPQEATLPPQLQEEVTPIEQQQGYMLTYSVALAILAAAFAHFCYNFKQE